jgi:hypothetical protein
MSLFRRMSRRFEDASTVVTSTKGFEGIFGNQIMASAFDRPARPPLSPRQHPRHGYAHVESGRLRRRAPRWRYIARARCLGGYTLARSLLGPQLVSGSMAGKITLKEALPCTRLGTECDMT